MHKSGLTLLSVVASLILAAGAGCGSDSAAGAAADGGAGADAGSLDEVSVVPFDSTKMLAAADLVSLEPDKEDGTLVFDDAPAVLADVAVGTVLVAGIAPSTPHGFIRVVTDLTRAGGKLTLQTQGAPPQLAFQKLHARVVRAASLDDADPQPNDSVQVLDLGVGIGGNSNRTVPVDVILFDGDGDPTTTADQLRIQGSFSGSIAYDLTLDIDWGAVTKLPDVVATCVASLAKLVVGKKPSCSLDELIPEVKVEFKVDPGVASNLTVSGGAALGFEKDFDIATIPLPIIPLGPLVFTPHLVVVASVKGSATSAFKDGVDAQMAIETSVAVSTKTAGAPVFQPPTIKDKSFTVQTPEVGLFANAQANAGVRLEMPLYGTIGPYGTAEATLTLNADASQTPCWSLRAGLESVIGVLITSPNLPVLGHVTLVNWSTPPFKAIDDLVASGACTDPPPGVPHLPPGSGPDAPTLRAPTFTPWSHTETLTLASSANVGPSNTGNVFSDLDRAIDGRWLVAGSDARTLEKIDDGGNRIWRAAFQTDAGTPLDVIRTQPARDASIAALAVGAGGASFSILELGQSGGVKSARSYSLPLDTCANSDVRVFAADAAPGSGYTIAGECLEQGRAFVVHVDAGLNVTATNTWTVDGASSFGATAFTRTTTGQLVLTGTLSRPASPDGLFVARMDDAGTLLSLDPYNACASSFGVSPTVITPGPSNGVYLAGGSNGQARSFVTSVREDGSVAFSSFPGLTNGHAPVFVPGGFAELPTSGFVMAAGVVELTATDSGVVPAVDLVGLDSFGQIQWANRYQLGNLSTGFPSLRLTTDGGALVSAFTYPTDGSTVGGTWAMKVFAKDGTLSDPSVTVTPLTMDSGDATCAFTKSTVVPNVSDALDVNIAPLTVIRQ